MIALINSLGYVQSKNERGKQCEMNWTSPSSKRLKMYGESKKDARKGESGIKLKRGKEVNSGKGEGSLLYKDAH